MATGEPQGCAEDHGQQRADDRPVLAQLHEDSLHVTRDRPAGLDPSPDARVSDPIAGGPV